MENIIVVNNPLVLRDLTILRDKNSSTVTFKNALGRISLVLAVEAGRNHPIAKTEIETPLEKTDGFKFQNNPILLPVLRAGLGMLESFREMFPESAVGMIGTKRNEDTLAAQNYYINIPPSQKHDRVFLLDPMLATGGTGIHAITTLKFMGYNDILYISIISAPEGVTKVQTAHPGIQILTCSVDRELNSNGYILPGLGDAGDRYFAT